MDISNEPENEGLPWKQIVRKAVHDMRTPLSSMRVSLEVLRMTSGSPEGQEKIHGMMGKQIDLVADLLETLSKNPQAFMDPPASQPRLADKIP